MIERISGRSNFLFNRILRPHPIQFRCQRLRLRQVAGIPECLGTTPELGSAVFTHLPRLQTEPARHAIGSQKDSS